MPRLPATATSILPTVLHASAFVLCVAPAWAQTPAPREPDCDVQPLCVAPAFVQAQAPAPAPVPSPPAQSTPPLPADAPWLKLKLDQALSETRTMSRDITPTFARAQSISGTVEEQIVLEGEAEVRRGGTVLRGDRITYTRALDQVDVNGNARIYRQGAVFSGPELSFRIDAQTGSMSDAEFRYPARNGRGEATLIEFLGEQRARMENARFTTCAPGDDAWWVQAEKLEVDGLEQDAVASTARLYFQGVPILASPIFGFPLGDERRSGFLTPSFGLSSTVGTDIRTPYYWNIAPNYDYTFSPRVMTKRGVLLGNEFRFLQPTVSGTLVYDVLPDDRRHEEGSRYYSGTVLNYASPSGVAGGINYHRVSDDNYFVDFSSTILGSSQKVLPQDGFLSYVKPYWSTMARVTGNQVLQDPLAPIAPPYEREPQVTVTGFVADWKGFEAGAILDGTRFKAPEERMQEGSRYIINPRIEYPFLRPGWFITPRAQLSATYYNLDHEELIAPADRDKTDSRVLPIFSLDGGLIFERNVTWFGRAAQQTLEPRLFYAYIPYREQNHLPNFDSALADINYSQFFTENIYSGYDRIVNANQLTLAVATRVLDDETGAEWLRAALGQRYYFTDQKVTLPGESPRAGNESDLLGAITAQLGNNWAMDIAVQYSAEQSTVSRATAGARWQPRRASVISAYYRYQEDVTDQADIAFQWPITERWYAVGRYNYSFDSRKTIEAIAGFEYKQDCWLLRFAVQRFQTTTESRTTNFYLQLELAGFTSVGTSALNQLQRNIPGYQRINPLPRQPGMFEYYE